MITESAYNLFYFWLPTKLLLLSIILFDYITRFTTYYAYYIDKLIGNSTLTFIYAANCLCFLYDLNNLWAVFLYTYNSSICIAEPGLVSKKRKPLRTFLYFFYHLHQPQSFFFNSMLFNKIDKTGKQANRQTSKPGEYETGEYRMEKNKYLTILKRVASVTM